MSETDEGEAGATEDEAPKKKSKAPLLIGLVLALAGGGGGFFASYSGVVALPAAIVGGGDGHEEQAAAETPAKLEGVAYVALDELVIPLSPDARARFLAFKADIEVAQADVAGFEALRPRLRDIFNTFLRAVEESDLETPSASARLRAQLLRRIRVVAAPMEPRDLLISTFVLK